MMMPNKSAYVTIDDADKPNPNTPKLPDYNNSARPVRRSGYRPTMGLFIVAAVFGVGAVVLGYALLSPVVEEWRWWVEDNGAFFRTLFYVIVCALVGAALFALYAFGRWAHHKAQGAAIVHLENGHPVNVADITGGWQRQGAANMAGYTLGQHYRVQETWAAHSGMRGLGQYAPTLNTTTPALGPQAAALLPGDSANEVAPVAPAQWLAWVNEAPHVLLAAETGGGKSTTAKKILEPRIAAGEDVFVIDPHSSEWFDLPSVGGGEDWAAVRQALTIVGNEYRNRLAARDEHIRSTGRELSPEHFKRLTVLLDEANITRANLDVGRRGEITPWKLFAETLGSGARKVRISVLLLAQSANVDDIGLSGPMRENFTRLALDSATIRRMIDTEEKDPARRKALYAAMVGSEYPATIERRGQVYLIDRTGINQTDITSARHTAGRRTLNGGRARNLKM